MERQRYPRSNGPSSVLGLDFGKYLLSKDKRVIMESDVTTGTESDTSDLDPGRWQGYHSGNRSSEYSEDSDDYQGYYEDGRRLPGVYDTNIDSADDSFYDHYHVQKGQKRGYEDDNDIKIRQALAQLNAPVSNNDFGRPLYSIHETASLVSESSADHSDSQSGTPVHRPVYGRYQKLSNQNDHLSSSSNQDPDDSDSDSLETLILHRLPGENLGMILGIEGGKDDTGNVSHVLVKSVTLGGAAYRATGSKRGVCVSDEIIKVNGTDIRTLSHDECISVFKDMPLRVLLGVRRGQKNLPPVEISPNEAEKIDRKFDFQHSVNAPVNSRYDYSDSEDEKMTGFVVYKVRIEKEPYENLGLSIVPSYGSTKEFYQIKRILPSGAAAHSRQLQVGDRLITCNGYSLKRLTQNHCLNILKSASAKGDVELEVIRPVDNGNPMEISVTLNNSNTELPGLDNSQLSRFDSNNSRTTSFDPSQYSLKSQSYDRHVDVVVTSESEDYLTLSEDEYSRTGRLANISEAKAHEIFSGQGFKLAYQRPFTSIDEVNSETDTLTETETEFEGSDRKLRIPEREVSDKEVDIVDLNIDSSPYHIATKLHGAEDNKENKTKQHNLATSVSDLDNVIISSSAENLHSKVKGFQHPKTDIDSISIGSKDIPSSDLDKISLKSENNLFPKSGIAIDSNIKSLALDSSISKTENTTPVGTPYLHPRQQVPVSEIDDVSIGPDVKSDESKTVKEDLYYPDLNSGIIGIEFPESHLYIGDNSSLCDEEGYDLSDSEKYFQPVSDGDEEVEAALPPPVEFSDSNYTDHLVNNHINIIPVTNIDDFNADSSSPIDQNIDLIEGEQEHPEAELARLEASLRDLDEASSDQPNSVPYYIEPFDENLEIQQDTSLPLHYEVTINNQRVPDNSYLFHTSDIQQTPPFDKNTSELPSEYEVTINNQIVPQENNNLHYSPYDFHDSKEILQVLKNSDQVTRLIPVTKRNSPSAFQVDNYNNNSTMDTTSEAMLKNALDIEYDMITESEKVNAKIILGDSRQSEEADLDDPSFMNENIVAESVAQEMIKSEQNNHNYYMESDDEPDSMPDQDMYDEPPDLPDMPPPVLHTITMNEERTSSSNFVPSQSKSDKTHADIDAGYKTKTIQFSDDPNWSFKVKDSEKRETSSEKEISPTKTERMSEVRVQFSAPKNQGSVQKTESDIIVPIKVDRKPNIPTKILVQNGRGETGAPKQEVIIEPKATVTVNAVKPKVPPAVAPKPSPRKITENKDLGKNVAVVQLQHVDEYADKSPVEEPVVEPMAVHKDKSKSAFNVVKVISALKDKSVPGERPVSPIEARFREAVKSNDRERQSPPPKREIIEANKEIIQKPKPRSGVRELINTMQAELSQESQNATEKVDKSPVRYKTQIEHSKESEPKVLSHETKVVPNEPKELSNDNLGRADAMKDSKETKTATDLAVPRLDLGSVGSSESGSLSPKSDKSDSPREKNPVLEQEKVHKTTIGVSKQDKDKTVILSGKKDHTPVADLKQLSQIKPLSFNPKSLSKPQPVQYRTTINTLGSKPSGISTLGRSSLLSSQKAEHPIKRMETMPFEVSILKGILGIGIKTKITPEGFVQITEILPSGPVGREGNIKVGDYLLSINNTELTGLPDSKVQQILRLLPRGLSKIVASPVPPELGDTSDVKEKKTASPRASVPLVAAQQPPLSVSQKSATLPSSRRQVNITSTKQPVVSTRSLPFASKPFGSSTKEHEREVDKKEKSPVTSPKSPKSTKLMPALAPRQREKHSTSSESPDVSPRSPHVSPRKTESENSSQRFANVSIPPPVSPRSDSEKSSPRTPPRVAPKPMKKMPNSELTTKGKESELQQNDGLGSVNTEIFAQKSDSEKSSPRTPPQVTPKPRKNTPNNEFKTKEKESESQQYDELGPIETEIFASISGPKSEHVPIELTGPTLMPGSVTCDYVSTKGKADMLQGKVDVVESTESPVTENKLEQEEAFMSPKHETSVHIDIVESTSKAPDTVVIPENPKEINLSVQISIAKDNDSDHKPNVAEPDINDAEPEVCEADKVCVQKENELNLDRINDHEITTDEKHELQTSDSSTVDDFHFKALEHMDDFVEIAGTQKERSESVSSESSYTEFHECTVEDESNLEDITEENDTETNALESAINEQDELNEHHEVYTSMAQHIVADVIENVKAMDLSESHKDSSKDSIKTMTDIDNVEHSEFPSKSDASPPPLPDSDAPPLPISPCPVTDSISQNISIETCLEQNIAAESSNLSSEPKDVQSIPPVPKVEPPSDCVVEDVTECLHTSQLHASIPTIVISVNSDNTADKSAANDETVVYSQERLTLDTDEQGEYTDDFENESSDNDDKIEDSIESEHVQSVESTKDDNPDDQSINTVISLYADIEKSIIHNTDANQNIDTVVNVKLPSDQDKKIDGELQMMMNKDLVNDETESVETKSLTSSDDVLSDGDIIESQENSISQPHSDTDIPKAEPVHSDMETAKVNGFSTPSSKRDLERPKDIKVDTGSEKADSSFSSDSAMSPARSATPHSDDDRTEVDRFIRLMSQDQESQHTGEGEIMKVRMNKGVTGVGFVIQGGKASPKGDLPITVKRIFKGGPADQCGQLQVNDEILDVNGENITEMRHSEAWQHLKFLPSGEVTMTVRRYSS